MSRGSDRRSFLKLSAATLALAPACKSRESPPPPPPEPAPPPPVPVNAKLVRVASVPTAVEGNVLPGLVHDFEQRSGIAVQISARPDVYDAARAGKVDLVISHYGHHDTEGFVLDGLGEWPRTVFSNQMALVGPPNDPAKIRGLGDAAEAFQRIAARKSAFLINDIEGVRYLTEILWNAIGRPSREGWLFDDKIQKENAMRAASQRGAYTLWGLTPFLRLHKQESIKLEPLVLADPLLQRLLVSVVVKSVPGVNAVGALALQSHLLEPATQARIRATEYPTDGHVYWVPAGRHNRSTMLPKA